MLNDFCWYLPTEVIFGENALAELKAKAGVFGRKALLVTGRKFARESGLLDEIEFLLGEAEIDLAVFAGAEEDPTTEIVERGAKICRKEKCAFVIGAGGGSAMDTAKGIAVLATNKGKLSNFFGSERTLATPLPVVAVPTTSGSGSEVTRYAVIIDPEAKTKKTVSCGGIIPKLALIQPSLTLSLSPFLTASTGLDALSHAVEGALAGKITPLTLAIAQGAVKTIREALPEAVKNPAEIEHRRQMSLAAMMAGMVINQTGTIIGHGMGYPLTINYRVQHGTASSIMLPAIFEFLADKGYRERITEITGWPDPSDGWRKFCRRVGLPVTLSEIGAQKSDLKGLAREATAGCQRSMENMGLTLTEKEFYGIYAGTFGTR